MGTITIEDQYTSGVYAKRQLEITGGQGALLFDIEGREYIDCVGGQGVASLGHAHPAVAQAVAAQAQQLINLPEMFYHPLRAALLERLAVEGGDSHCEKAGRIHGDKPPRGLCEPLCVAGEHPGTFCEDAIKADIVLDDPLNIRRFRRICATSPTTQP